MIQAFLWCARSVARIEQLWQDVTRRQGVERDLEVELQGYLELLVTEKLAEGVPPADARAAALGQLGDIEQVKADVRRQRALAVMWRTVDDVRVEVLSSLRLLFTVRAAGTTAAVLIIGLVGNVALSNLAQVAGARLASSGAASVAVRAPAPLAGTLSLPRFPTGSESLTNASVRGPGVSPERLARSAAMATPLRHHRDSSNTPVPVVVPNPDGHDGAVSGNAGASQAAVIPP